MISTFFDYNSTTPVCPEALEAMLPYFSNVFANPSGQTSSMSWQSQSAIKLAKKEISELVDCSENEIFFTSGATESINWVFEDFFKKQRPVLISNIDHDASFQKTNGAHVFKSLDNGQPDMTYFKDSLAKLPQGSLVSLIFAHNEVGTILDLEALTPLIKQHGHYVHVDATQALGKLEFSFKNLKIDFLSCSAHKTYGPKGIGALILNRKTVPSIEPLIYGGGQQEGLRSGTLNTPLIVGFGKACLVAQKRVLKDKKHFLKLKTVFLEELDSKNIKYKLNGDLHNMLSNTIHISFLDWKSLAPLYLELIPYSVSQSSACSTESDKKRILNSLGVLEPNTIRISLGRSSDVQNTKGLALKIIDTLQHLKNL